MIIGLTSVSAARKPEPTIVLTQDGEKFQVKYDDMPKALQAEITKALPVVAGATPHGLVEFAQQGSGQEALVDRLLGDDALMKQMLIAGGASSAKYGQAMQIYAAIQQASPKAGEGVFQRLALATSLQHAVPIKQSNARDQKKAPTIADPVKRRCHSLVGIHNDTTDQE